MMPKRFISVGDPRIVHFTIPILEGVAHQPNSYGEALPNA